METLEIYLGKQITRIYDVLQSLNCLAMCLNRRVRVLEEKIEMMEQKK